MQENNDWSMGRVMSVVRDIIGSPDSFTKTVRTGWKRRGWEEPTYDHIQNLRSYMGQMRDLESTNTNLQPFGDTDKSGYYSITKNSTKTAANRAYNLGTIDKDTRDKWGKELAYKRSDDEQGIMALAHMLGASRVSGDDVGSSLMLKQIAEGADQTGVRANLWSKYHKRDPIDESDRNNIRNNVPAWR